MKRPDEETPRVSVRPLDADDRSWLRELARSLWGLPVVTLTRSYEHPEALDGFVAEVNGDHVGVITYDDADAQWEIVTVNALVPRIGVGRAMLDAVRDKARQAGATGVRLITTDTNLTAIAFYERIGMRQVAVHPDFIVKVRDRKPSLDPDVFHDAIEFEWPLVDSDP